MRKIYKMEAKQLLRKNAMIYRVKQLIIWQEFIKMDSIFVICNLEVLVQKMKTVCFVLISSGNKFSIDCLFLHKGSLSYFIKLLFPFSYNGIKKIIHNLNEYVKLYDYD